MDGSQQIATKFCPGERAKFRLELQRLILGNWPADFALGVMAPTACSLQIATTNPNAKPRNPKLPPIT